MQIKTTRNIFISGQFVQAGTVVETPDQAGRNLISMGKAVKYTQPAEADDADSLPGITPDTIIARIESLELVAEVEALLSEAMEMKFNKKEKKTIAEAAELRVLVIQGGSK